MARSRVRMARDKTNNSNNNKKKQDVVWSTYTLRNALVSTPSTLQCLQTDTTVLAAAVSSGDVGNSKGEKGGQEIKKEKEEEEELVLDDYGDLSILLPLLQQQSEADSTADSSSPSANTNNNNEEEETKEELILLNGHIQPRSPPTNTILDASNYTIRIILEKYTISSIKDHVVRVRSMLVEGGMPFVTSLVGDVDDGESVEVAEGVEKGEKEVEAKVEVEKKGDKSKVRVYDIDMLLFLYTHLLHLISPIHISISYTLYRNTHRMTTNQPKKNNKISNVSNKSKLPNNYHNINQIMICFIHLLPKTETYVTFTIWLVVKNRL